MGTRDEILAALKAHPKGLTSKELAPLCPACECDELVVGRNVAQLRSEKLIHGGAGHRNGADAVWFYGPPQETVPEQRVSLESRRQEPSVAAREIAALRQFTTAPKPPPTPKRPGVGASIRQKVEELLKAHGPMDCRTMRKRGLSGDTLSQHLSYLADMNVLHRLGGGRGTTIFGLPGQKLEDATTKPERQPLPGTPRHRAPPRASSATRFAITEAGELEIAIEGGDALHLPADAFTRLRDFIARTKPIWEPA